MSADRGLAAGFLLLADPETCKQEPGTSGQKPEAKEQDYCLKLVFVICKLPWFAGNASYTIERLLLTGDPNKGGINLKWNLR